MTGVLALDVGTTSTAAAVWSGGTVVPLAFADGIPCMPSSVGLEHPGEPLVSGMQAERHGLEDPTTYEPTPKRWVGQGLVPLGGSTVRDVDLVAAVLREVTTQARRAHPTLTVERTVMTHPPAWRRRRLGVWREAARLVGLPAPTLLAEPCATAAFFAASGHPAPTGSTVGVLDLGGTAFRVATVRCTESGFELGGASAADLALGGDSFDEALTDHVGRTLGERGATWDSIDHPPSPEWARHRRELWVAVRRARESLSTSRSTSVTVPGLEETVLITRDEYDTLVGDLVDHLVDHARTGLAQAGTPLDDLAAVYLVGGAARSPVVARRFLERTGITPLTLDQPKLSVCLGAAHLVRGVRPARVEPTVPPGATTVMERPVPAGATVITTRPPIDRPASSPADARTATPGASAATVVITRPAAPVAEPSPPTSEPPPGSPEDVSPEPGSPEPVTRRRGGWRAPRVLLGAGAALAVVVVGVVLLVARQGSPPVAPPSTYVSDTSAEQLMASSTSCAPAAYLIPTDAASSGIACPSGGLSQELYKTSLPGEREVTDALRAALPGMTTSPADVPGGAAPASPIGCSTTYRWSGTASSGSPVALVIRVSRARPFVAATRFVPDQTQSFESVERTPFPVSDLKAYCG